MKLEIKFILVALIERTILLEPYLSSELEFDIETHTIMGEEVGAILRKHVATFATEGEALKHIQDELEQPEHGYEIIKSISIKNEENEI